MSSRGLAGVLAVLAWVGSAPAARAAPEKQPPAPETQPPAPEEQPAPPAALPDPLHVYVMTMGPGDHPFFRFGHNAIWIRDDDARTDRVYNFGTFRFDSPRLIFDFLGGRLNYWLSVSSLARVVSEYQRENRSVAAQELDLMPDEKRELAAALDVNARPENRLYKYDYFLDNCSTRVRDAIDRLVKGQLHTAASQPGRMTLRQHALRMTAQPLWLYLALDIVLGPKVDRPIDQWTEMFLPGELAGGLGAAQVTRTRPVDMVRADLRIVQTQRTASGPLVRAQTELARADRPPPRERPPAWGTRFFAAGLGWGALMFVLGWAGRLRRASRVALGILISLWGLAVGFVGCFLVYAWAFTDHVVAHRNQNILLCAPWAIALVGFGVGVALGRPGATRTARALAVAALVAVVIALAFKIGIVAHQENGALIAFFFPAWLGIAGALSTLRYATAFETSIP